MYTQEEKDKRFEQVCQRIEQGEPLRRILRSDNAPMSADLFYDMVKDKSKSERYARAREIYADNVFEEMLDIADCEDNDIIETDEGPRVNHDVIQRDRLRVDTRKWMLSKLQPKKYGDKLEHDHKSSDGSMSPTPTAIVFTKPDAKDQ